MFLPCCVNVLWAGHRGYKWISHVIRTHLKRKDGRTHGYGANYRKVTVLIIHIIVLNIPGLLKHTFFESLKVLHSSFFPLTNHPPLQLVENQSGFYFLQTRHGSVARLALLLKRHLREKQGIHHLTHQESNSQFWESMLSF